VWKCYHRIKKSEDFAESVTWVILKHFFPNIGSFLFLNWINCRQVCSCSNVWNWNLHCRSYFKTTLLSMAISIFIMPEMPMGTISSKRKQILGNFHFVTLVHISGTIYQHILPKSIPYFNKAKFKHPLTNITITSN
jgi:hypothetical protein